MADTVLLIDFENVGKIDLGAIPDGVRVPFFIGASQKSIAKDFFKAALKLGERFECVDIRDLRRRRIGKLPSIGSRR